MVITATHAGVCALCEATIAEGERITDEHDLDGWAHEDCLLQPLPFDSWPLPPSPTQAPTASSAERTHQATTAHTSAESDDTAGSSSTAAGSADTAGAAEPWARVVRLGPDSGVLVTIEGQLLQLVLIDQQLELHAIVLEYDAGGELLDRIAEALRELVWRMRA